ncbi:MAG: hypothetical protein OHK0039_39960 [Bacteroidia bacterium]
MAAAACCGLALDEVGAEKGITPDGVRREYGTFVLGTAKNISDFDPFALTFFTITALFTLFYTSYFITINYKSCKAKQKSRLIAFVYIFAILSTFSCQKSPILPPEAARSAPQSLSLISIGVESGRIVIPAYTDLPALIHTFQQYQEERSVWYDWLSSFDYKPIYEAYRKTTEADFEMIASSQSLSGFEHLYLFKKETDRSWEIVEHVPNPFWRTLVNEEGLLQIEDDVYKFFFDYMVKVVSPTREQVAYLNEIAYGEPLPQWAERISISREGQEASSLRSGNTNCTTIYASNPQRRINATIVYETVAFEGVYSHFFYAEVKHQRRTLLIWEPRQARFLGASGIRSCSDPALLAAWGGSSFSFQSSNKTNDRWLIGYFNAIISDDPEIHTVDASFTSNNEVRDKDNGPIGTCTNDRAF